MQGCQFNYVKFPDNTPIIAGELYFSDVDMLHLNIRHQQVLDTSTRDSIQLAQADRYYCYNIGAEHSTESK
jgi:hypothetical protein